MGRFPADVQAIAAPIGGFPGDKSGVIVVTMRNVIPRLPLRTLGLLFATAIAFAVVAPSPSGAIDEDWRQLLVEQLAEEESCVVSFFSQVSVIRQNDREIIAARAHCDDQRAFDVTRISPATTFDLRACETSDDRTC